MKTLKDKTGNFLSLAFKFMKASYLQGVPENIIVGRQLETLSLFVTFSRQPTLTYIRFLKQ